MYNCQSVVYVETRNPCINDSRGGSHVSFTNLQIKLQYSSRNFEDELAFLIPAMVDGKFTKAQIFCNSRSLSDLVGSLKTKFNNFLNFCNITAAWISKELKSKNKGVAVAKLNGENSQKEKERVTQQFKEGYEFSLKN